MPTLLITFGIRFFFYLDEHEPIHVHVSYEGKKAKIELVPQVNVVYNHGLKEQTLKKAVATYENFKNEFVAEWHRRFG